MNIEYSANLRATPIYVYPTIANRMFVDGLAVKYDLPISKVMHEIIELAKDSKALEKALQKMSAENAKSKSLYK